MSAPSLRRWARSLLGEEDVAVPVDQTRSTGASALADQLARARAALELGQHQEVVDDLETSLDVLNMLASATWATLGSAYDKLDRSSDRDRAYRQAVNLFRQAKIRPGPVEIVAIVPALHARGKQNKAIDALRAVAAEHPSDIPVARLLASELDDAGDPSAAEAYVELARLLPAGHLPEELIHLRRSAELDAQSLDNRVALGRALVRAGQAGDAVDVLQSVVASLPPDHVGHVWRAEAVRAVGRPADALLLLDGIVAGQPDDTLALLMRARASLDLGQTMPAEADLDKAIGLDPRMTSALRARAELYQRAGRVADALVDVRAALDVEPDDAGGQAQLGRLLAQDRQMEDARAAFDRALRLDPDDVSIRCQRAGALPLPDAGDEALSELGRVLERDPTSVDALVGRARVLAALGRRHEALGDVARAQAVVVGDDRRAEVIETEAQILSDLGRYADAVSSYDRLLVVRPDDLDARAGRVRALLGAGDITGAAAGVGELVTLAPASAEAHLLQGQVLLSLSDLDGALRAFETALSASAPSSPSAYEARSSLGRTLRQLGRIADATAIFDEILAADAGDAPALVERGLCSLIREDAAGAAVDLADGAARARERGDQDLEFSARAWLGEALRASGAHQEALEALDAALALVPGSAFALGTKGQVLSSLNLRSEAVEALTEAVRLDPSLYWAHASLAELYRLDGRNEDALAELDLAAPGGESSYTRGTRGQVLAALGRVPEAVAELRAAWAEDRAAWIADELAQALASLSGKELLEEALGVIDEALATVPDSRALLLRRADTLRLLGRAAEGLAAIERYLVVDQDDAGLVVRAHLLLDLKRSEEGLKVVRDVLGRSPDYAFARYAEIRALKNLDAYTDGLAAANALLAISSEDAYATELKAWMLCDLRRFDEVTGLLADLLRRTPDRPFANGLAGFAARRSVPPDLQGAVARLRAAIEVDPGDPWYQVELADALDELGPGTEARDLREGVIARVLDAGLASAGELGLAGWAALFLDRTDEAVRQLGEAVQLDPDDLPLRFCFGLALLHADKTELALDEYRSAVYLVEGHLGGARRRAILAEALDDIDRAVRRNHPSLTPEVVADVRQVLAPANADSLP